MRKDKVFNDLSISERIRLLSDRYHEEQTAEGRERIGQEYGMSTRNVARYVRCDKLRHEFKAMLDAGTITLSAAGEISFLSDDEQGIVLDVMKSNGIGVDKDMAKAIRSTVGNITTETIQRVYGLDKPLEQIKEAVSVMIPARVYSRFFSEVAVKDVGGIVEEALEQYFDRKGA